MNRITFTLPEQLEEKIKELQKLKGLTISDLVRRGLELLIKEAGL